MLYKVLFATIIKFVVEATYIGKSSAIFFSVRIYVIIEQHSNVSTTFSGIFHQGEFASHFKWW